MFFFEKKNQKTLDIGVRAQERPAAAMHNFCFVFQKTTPSLLTPQRKL
jgi:hypothetical protein